MHLWPWGSGTQHTARHLLEIDPLELQLDGVGPVLDLDVVPRVAGRPLPADAHGHHRRDLGHVVGIPQGALLDGAGVRGVHDGGELHGDHQGLHARAMRGAGGWAHAAFGAIPVQSQCNPCSRAALGS